MIFCDRHPVLIQSSSLLNYPTPLSSFIELLIRLKDSGVIPRYVAM